MRIGMQGKIVFVYSLLILFAMQLSGVYLVKSLENYYLRNFAAGQVLQAELLSSFILRYLIEDEQQSDLISSLIVEFEGNVQGTETMVLDRNGRLLGKSDRSVSYSPGERVIQDDILLALSGNRVEGVRIDPETKIRYHTLALPIKDGASVVGVVYLTGSLETIYMTLREIKVMLITGWIIVLAIAIVISFMLTRTITLPIRGLTKRAAAMAGGDFSQLIDVHSNDEIGELAGTFNFLTTRLKETLQEISAEKNKVETLLKYLRDGIIAINKEGEIIHLNPAAQELLKFTGVQAEPESSGKEILRKFFSNGEVEELLSSKVSQTKEVELEVDGEKILQMHIAPIKESEHLQGYLLVLHDVTKERAFSRLQQEFVADVSHELRTPLTTIKSYVETLLNGAQENPLIRGRFLQVLEKETERMVKLVRDLLVLSQLDYQKANWTREKSDLITLVEEVLEQIEMEAKSKGINLRRKMPGEKVKVFLDRDKIKQVILNLLDNAVKFTPSGGRVDVEVTKDESFAFVSIRDTGIGIPAEDIPRVFDRFYRVDKTRSRESGGTGLGLSIARKIIRASGGKITLSSVPEKGTEVTFSLPLA
ncbi:MAG: cell wall metabolism sensor histidine kinase WalK [Firmicutes bacterium]|nr:cell wall metabolism sensor histidine kinase WalK [Bacillota bacterium]